MTAKKSVKLLTQQGSFSFALGMRVIESRSFLKKCRSNLGKDPLAAL